MRPNARGPDALGLEKNVLCFALARALGLRIRKPARSNACVQRIPRTVDADPSWQLYERREEETVGGGFVCELRGSNIDLVRVSQESRFGGRRALDLQSGYGPKVKPCRPRRSPEEKPQPYRIGYRIGVEVLVRSGMFGQLSAVREVSL